MSLIRNGSVLQKPVFVSWWHLWAWQCVDIRKHSLQWQGRLDNPPQLLSIHHSWQNLPGGTQRYTWRWQLQITARQHISKCQADIPQLFVTENKLSTSFSPSQCHLQPFLLSPLLQRLNLCDTFMPPLFSLTQPFFFQTLNPQLLSRLFSCLDGRISPLRSNFTLLCFLLNSTVWLLP